MSRHNDPRITRLLQYCLERSSGVESKYMRWLVSDAGKCSEGFYCVDCVKIQRYVERHRKSGLTDIDGWDESFYEDSQRFCERCGVVLECSLTKHGIDEEVRHLTEDATSLHDTDCWTIARFLDGYGDWRDEEHGPLLAPHVERLISGSEARNLTNR